MNNVVFAIPGLMPPKAPNWHSELIAPEDGSLCLLLHAGAIDDTVTYAIDIRGIRPGVIKDPDYEYVGGRDDRESQIPHQALLPTLDRSSWPDFLRTSSELPTSILIPRKVYCGCPIPIDELPELQDLETVWYYILELPIRSLPMGDTVVEVCINGKMRKYTVQRPAFKIHSKSALTYRYSVYTPALKEEDVETSYYVSGNKGATFTLEFNLEDLKKALPPKVANQQIELQLTLTHGGTVINFTNGFVNTDNNISIIKNELPDAPYYEWQLLYRVNARDNSWLIAAEGIQTKRV